MFVFLQQPNINFTDDEIKEADKNQQFRIMKSNGKSVTERLGKNMFFNTCIFQHFIETMIENDPKSVEKIKNGKVI